MKFDLMIICCITLSIKSIYWQQFPTLNFNFKLITEIIGLKIIWTVISNLSFMAEVNFAINGCLFMSLSLKILKSFKQKVWLGRHRDAIAKAQQ